MKKKVYLSSTKEDLILYREAVRAAIRPFWDCVSMEDYLAEDQTPVEKCLRDVKQCDIYVGIFARRYGYVPPGYDKSITELEYRAAEECGIPKLIFLLDVDTVPWLERLVERGDGEIALNVLKDELRKQKMVRFFTTPDNLANLVVGSIHQVMGGGEVPESCIRMVGDRKGSLDDLLRAAKTSGDIYLQEMEAQRIYLPHVYARRIAMEAHLRGFLDHKCTKSGMLVVGTSGIGKTNTLCHIVRQWRDDKDFLGSDVVLFLGAAALPASLTVEDAVLDGLQVVGDFDTFANGFEHLRRKDDVQLAVIIDGVDKHPQPDEFLRQINRLVMRGQSWKWLKVVVSIGEVAYDGIRAAGTFVPSHSSFYTVAVDAPEGRRECAEVVLGRLTEEELQEAFEKYQRQVGMAPKTPFGSLSDDVKNALTNPLVLRIVMENFNEKTIPARVLSAEVLSQYCERKIFSDLRRQGFVFSLVEILLKNRAQSTSIDSLLNSEDKNLREQVQDTSLRSAYVQLKDEMVLTEQSEGKSRIFGQRKNVAFTYDRLLEYILARLIARQPAATVEDIVRFSHAAPEYAPLRGAFTMLLLDWVSCGNFQGLSDALKAGYPNVMRVVTFDLLLELEQTAPASAKSTEKELADSTVGQLVDKILALPCEWGVQTLLDFAERLRDFGLYRRASFVLGRLCSHSQQSGDRQAEATVLLGMANLETLQGHHQESAGYCERCQALVDSCPGLDGIRPLLLRAKANNFYRLGDLEKSKSCCDEWLAKYTGNEFLRLRADIWRIRGVVLRWDFRLREALESYMQGASLADQLDDNYLRAYFCNNIGEVHRRQGSMEQAAEWHERARRIRQEIGDRGGLSMSCNNLALISQELGNRCRAQGDMDGWRGHYRAARRSLEAAVQIADEIGDDQRKADALNNLGTLARVEERRDEAETLYRGSQQLFLKGKSKNDLGIVSGNLGIMAYARSDHRQARQCFEEARCLFEDAGNEAYAAYVYHNLAHLYALGEQKASVSELLQRRDQIVDQRPEYPWPDALRSEQAVDLVDMPDI